MDYCQVVVGALETNCYVVYCPHTLYCAVIDPGAQAKKIIQIIEEKELQPVILINTHAHVDHVGANKDIKDKFAVPLCIHQSDLPLLENSQKSGLRFLLGAKNSPHPDRFLKEGERVEIGQGYLKVIHTPGHSPGSISLLGDGYILSGDTLFNRGVGRTDLPGGSWEELKNSIHRKILTLPGKTVVLPGHGPSTYIGQEKENNPYI